MGALDDVLAERAKQNAKWGEQNHDPFAFLAILTEEVGELAKAALHNRFGGPDRDGMRAEAVQVAAVALQIVECLDRSKWAWGAHAKDPANVRGLELEAVLLDMIEEAGPGPHTEIEQAALELIDQLQGERDRGEP